MPSKIHLRAPTIIESGLNRLGMDQMHMSLNTTSGNDVVPRSMDAEVEHININKLYGGHLSLYMGCRSGE